MKTFYLMTMGFCLALNLHAQRGEYLLEKTKWDGVTDFEQIFKQIKSRFPQFFRPRLEGVRPMGRSQEEVPDDLSFRDRLRLFDENPEGYRGRFGR